MFLGVGSEMGGGARPLRRRFTMPTIELSAELLDRLDSHREEGESREELIAELVTMYETEGAFLREGYSE